MCWAGPHALKEQWHHRGRGKPPAPGTNPNCGGGGPRQDGWLSCGALATGQTSTLTFNIERAQAGSPASPCGPWLARFDAWALAAASVVQRGPTAPAPPPHLPCSRHWGRSLVRHAATGGAGATYIIKLSLKLGGLVISPAKSAAYGGISHRRLGIRPRPPKGTQQSRRPSSHSRRNGTRRLSVSPRLLRRHGRHGTRIPGGLAALLVACGTP